MRKGALVIFCFFSSFNCYPQQLAQYTQYMFNQYGLNPAVGGSKSCPEAKMGYRTQWLGFDDAPITEFFSINGVLPNKKRLNSRDKHAIGLYIEGDQTGPTSRTGIYVSYSYHKPITRNLYGSVGLFAGAMQYAFNANQTLVAMPDPVVASSRAAWLYPDLNPGVFIYGDRLYAGLSVKNVVGNSLTKIYGKQNHLTRHFYLSAGYKLSTSSRDYSHIPSFNLKFSPYGTPSLDLNYMADYRNKIAIGVSYRHFDALCALARVSISKFISAGYSFDYTLSKIRYASSNSHEIIIAIRICKNGGIDDKTNTICPAYQ